jgi:hypothetical protein
VLAGIAEPARVRALLAKAIGEAKAPPDPDTSAV